MKSKNNRARVGYSLFVEDSRGDRERKEKSFVRDSWKPVSHTEEFYLKNGKERTKNSWEEIPRTWEKTQEEGNGKIRFSPPSLMSQWTENSRQEGIFSLRHSGPSVRVCKTQGPKRCNRICPLFVDIALWSAFFGYNCFNRKLLPLHLTMVHLFIPYEDTLLCEIHYSWHLLFPMLNSDLSDPDSIVNDVLKDKRKCHWNLIPLSLDCLELVPV